MVMDNRNNSSFRSMAWALLLCSTITTTFAKQSQVGCAFVFVGNNHNNNKYVWKHNNVGSFLQNMESSVPPQLNSRRRALSILPMKASSDENNNNSNNNENNNNENNNNENNNNYNQKKGEGSSSEEELRSGNRSIREKYEREVKKAQLQAEINALLDDEEDLMVDLKAEMLKVDAIAPAQEQNKEESDRAWMAQQKEDDLFAAIDAQDYGEASQLKQDLDAIHIDDCGQVLHQNTLFYKAFSKRNFNVMSDLWLHDATVTCIHPSSPTLMGSNAVLSSFEKLLLHDHDDATHDPSANNNDAPNTTPIDLDPNHVRLHVRGNMAIVTCEEHVYQKKRFVRGKRPAMELVNKFIATNVFRKVQGQWFMVHHHATWHPDTVASQKATKISQQNKSISSSTKANHTNKHSNHNNNSNNNKHNSKSPQKSSLLDNPTTESFLGLPPSTEGLSTANSNTSNNNGGPDDVNPDGSASGPVRRVFMGSLGDLLNGGLNDILSGAETNEGDDDADDDDYLDDKEQDLMSLFDDDDDEDDDDLDTEDDDGDGDETINIVSRWPNANANDEDPKKKEIRISPKSIQKSIVIGRKAVNGGTGVGFGKDAGTNGKGSGKIQPPDHLPPPKDALRQNCIAALRRLANTGVITKKQKRMLLTDIITCSAKGEFSMVEVAYELLCGEIPSPPTSTSSSTTTTTMNPTKEDNEDDNEKDASIIIDPVEGKQEETTPLTNNDHDNQIDLAAESEEDFAEQCLAFAMSMPEYPTLPGNHKKE